MSDQFCIKSAYRFDYDITTASNFTVNTGPTVLKGTWLVTSAQVPATAYNIMAPNNIVYFHDTADRAVVLPEGYYDTTDIANALQTAMNGAGGLTYTVSVSPTNFKLTVTASSGTFYFSFGTNLPANYYRNPSFALANILGFGTTILAPAASVTAVYPLNFDYNNNLNISLRGVSSRNVDADSEKYVNINNTYKTGGKSYTFEIPIGGVDYGSMYQYIPNNQHQVVDFGQGVSKFEVTVFGDDDQPYSFNGANFTITLSKLK